MERARTAPRPPLSSGPPRTTSEQWSTVKRLQWPSWMPIDPYILLLLGTVGLAALLPARGTGADIASGASTAAIAFLFFLYGARLSTREAVEGSSTGGSTSPSWPAPSSSSRCWAWPLAASNRCS